MPNFPEKLEQKLQRRIQENALRKLVLPNDLVDFSSNDYLGFARDKQIIKIVDKLAREQDLVHGATGSRLLSGNHPLHEKLESFLANYHNSGAALVFNSGYDANLGFFSSVPQRNDIVFYDELCHASIRDGIQLGNAKNYKFKHNNIEDLQQKLVQAQKKINQDEPIEVYVVTESVFSMDGDSPDLKAFSTFCGQNGLHLVVDEAHAVGVFHKGLVNHLDLEKEVFARIITFGKAMGCHGAAILGGKSLREYLINFARSFIYTTALPPQAVAHILASYQHFEQVYKSRVEMLQENIVSFQDSVRELQLWPMYLKSDSAIQSILISGNSKVKQASKILRDSGFDARAILSPTVPKGEERLRFCLHTYNTKKEIKDVLLLLKGLL